MVTLGTLRDIRLSLFHLTIFPQRVGGSKYKTFKVARFLSLGNWWIVLAAVRIFLPMLHTVLQFLSLNFAHAPASYTGYWFFGWLPALDENLE